jgi:hypothetical protein
VSAMAFKRPLDCARETHPTYERLTRPMGVTPHDAGQRIGGAVDLDLEDEPIISVRAHRRSLPLRHQLYIGHHRLIFSPWSAEDRPETSGVRTEKISRCC